MEISLFLKNVFKNGEKKYSFCGKLAGNNRKRVAGRELIESCPSGISDQ
jgi:hypothetical protein